MSLGRLRTALATNTRHISPFLMLGDPDAATTVVLCRALVQAGATMLELGMPYADPSADGPVVQAAGERARAAGVSTEQALAILAQVREACPETPCNLLVYGNLVHARGYDRFCADAVAAGASSLLVPDIPLEEGGELYAACRRHELGSVLLAGPRTPVARLRRLADASDAFVYLAGHQGTTGAVHASDDTRRRMIEQVVAQIEVPVCVGFGLRSREDVAAVHAAGASIAVIGSHLLRVVQRLHRDHPGDVERLAGGLTASFHLLFPASPSSSSKESPSCS